MVIILGVKFHVFVILIVFLWGALPLLVLPKVLKC